MEGSVDIFRSKTGFGSRKVWETLNFRNKREMVDELHRKVTVPLGNVEHAVAVRALGGGGLVLTFKLGTGTRCRRVVKFTPLPHEKAPQSPIGSGVGWATESIWV
jgi:hypothetical protein